MKRLLVTVVSLLVVLAFAGTASAATLHATPSTFASTFASAAGGDTILLSSGSYGSWNGGAKTSMVTIAPESGASVSFSGGTFGTSVRNITVKGATYTGSVCINPPSNVKMNLILDGVTFAAVGQGCGEGRLSIRNGGTNAIDGNGVQIKNSTFGPGGCSDGIQDSSNGTEIGPGNEFKGIAQSCPASQAHADAIQPYASNYVHIHDNYLHDNEQGIMSPDGVSTGYLIENNVIHTTPGYPCMHLGDTRNGTVRHNVCRNGSIRVYGGNQNVNSQNMTIRDNVGGVTNGGCTGCTITNNPSVSSVTFTGTPAGTRCAYATASPKGTATDGTDVGLNDCGTAPPPPPPPTDHTPVARFTATPEPSAPGQTVTFDATSSTCEDTPCVYHWHDIAGGGDWPLGPDGATSTMVFQAEHPQSAPVKAELVLTDADGDVAKVVHDHVVVAAPPPPPPPSLDITNLRRDDAGTNDASQYGLIWFFWDPPQATAASYNLYVDGAAWWEHPTATHWWVGSPSWGCGSTHTISVQAVGTDGTAGPKATQSMSTAACP